MLVLHASNLLGLVVVSRVSGVASTRGIDWREGAVLRVNLKDVSIRSVKSGKRQENSKILKFLIFEAFSESLSSMEKLFPKLLSFK